MRRLIKKLLPEEWLRFIRPYYHGLLARLAAAYYGNPSNKLIVIGVTGTKGKTTATNLIAAILEQAGRPTGFASTANFKLGPGTVQEAQLNPYKMSTVSEWLLQKWLAAMVRSGVRHAVLEMTSEGLWQNRHAGINFDVAVFTNLSPEHLDAHENFENYQAAKAKLFKTLSRHPLTPAKLAINPDLKKTIVANLDDQYGQYFLNFKADQHVSFGVKRTDANFAATDIKYSPEGANFGLRGSEFKIQLKGQFDVYNSLAAIAAAEALGISLQQCRYALEQVAVVPGRVEVIQRQPFSIVVDYAHEPTGMVQLYETVRRWPRKRIIHVLGPTGGGRDIGHKAQLGALVAKHADIILITTDDPYDDDPGALAELMAAGARQQGKVINQNLFIELDRKKAITQAAQIAQSNDLILITGKGAEQKMVLARGKMIDWDDRTVAREALANLSSPH